MSERPYVDFKQVKEKVTIPAALAKLDLLDQFTEKKGVWTGVCPMQIHEHGPKPNANQFKFDNKRGEWLFKCFGDCNLGGDVIELVRGITGYSHAHVRLWFAEHFAEVLNLTKPKAVKRDEAKAATTGSSAVGESVLKPLKFYLDVDAAAAQPYLMQRGISIGTAERFGVGLYTKAKKMFTGYLVVPCYRYPKATPQEYPVGYVGRWPGDDFNDEDRPRYKVGFECSNAVFGLAEALDASRRYDPLIVVEGILTALWLISRGYTNAVSTFTASVSDAQTKLLIKCDRPIVLAFDGNDRGVAGMRTAAAKLIRDTFVRVVALPNDKEPDQLTSDELTTFLGFAKP